MLGRFELIKELGRGGFGVVWQARDKELGLDVALKFLPELVARDPESIEDLKREIRRGLKLTHPGIVRVHNFLRDEQLAAIAMELVEGDTLRGRKRAAPSGCLDVRDITHWIAQTCDVLTYVHEVARLVHRDLKPGNLMVTNAGEVKVADFGIASSLSDSLTRMTNTPASGGTLAYMSPQQARGEPPAVTDDIYALGASIYELLTGKPPFFRGDVVLQACEIVPPPMEARRREFGITDKEPIPEIWERVVAACLTKLPETRPQTVREIRALLAADHTVPAPITARGPMPMPTTLPDIGVQPGPSTTRDSRLVDSHRSSSRAAMQLPPSPYTTTPTPLTNTPPRTATTPTYPTAPPPPPPVPPSQAAPSLPPSPYQTSQPYVAPGPYPPQYTPAPPPAKGGGMGWVFGLLAGGVCLLGVCAWVGWKMAEPEAGSSTKTNGTSETRTEQKVVQTVPDSADAEALYRDGLAYENGTGRPMNAAQASVYYQKASDQGHVAAKARLARFLNYGLGVRRDEKKALALAEDAAKKGDPIAANLAAVILRGKRQDGPEVVRAVAYLEGAAQGGSPLAMLNLADHLRFGRGMAKDASRAEDLDRRAFALWQADAAAGNTEAHYWLGLCFEGGRGTTRDLQAAFREYQAAAKVGHPRSLLALALCYNFGYGVTADSNEAISYYQKAVDAGWLDAASMFAYQLASGSLPKDPQRAKGLYEQAIQNGSTEAIYRLGELLYDGDPAVRDEARAVKLFRQAADLDESDGWWRLGLAYENGRGGLAANEAEAFRCYQRAAEQDDRVGLYYVGRALRQGKGTSHDPARARTYLERSATAGLFAAMSELGEMLREGEGGSKDTARAAKLFAQAANGGYAAAQFQYAYSCEFGVGVDQNYGQAAEWYQKAAEQGITAAQSNLGGLYLRGQGVPQDYDKAVELFRKAAAAGNPWGETQLGWAYENGTGVPKDPVEAYSWFMKGAMHGQPAAQLQVGWYLHNGTGVDRDYAAARMWYERSAAQGNPRAFNNLGVLYDGGLGVKVSKAKAIEYYRKAAAAGDELAIQNLKRLGAK